MVILSSDIIEIKFSGGNISPREISLSELSHSILAIEKLLKPIIEKEEKDFVFDKSMIGFEYLGNHSISLRYFIKQKKKLILAAFSLLIECIITNNISELPAKTIDELENVSKFNSKYNCIAQLGETINNTFQDYTSFSNEFTAEKQQSINGQTTVYGKIEWIGGLNPTITLILSNGEKIDVSITEEDALKWNAYSNVGIIGDAVWKGRDLKLSKLRAKEIFEFNKTDLESGFKHLKQIFSGYSLNSDNI